jgi:hypothetical protein
MAAQQPVAPKKSKAGSKGFCLGCGLGCVGWGLLFALVLVALFWPMGKAFFPKEVKPLPEEPVVQSDAQGAAVLRQLGAEIALTIDEDHFNRYLTTKGEDMGIPPGVGRVYIVFEDGVMEARAEVSTFFRALQMKVRLRPKVENDQLVMHVDEVQAGPLTIPGFLMGPVQEMVKRSLEDATSGAGFDIKDLQVEKGKMTIKGQLKPLATEEEAGTTTQ